MPCLENLLGIGLGVSSLSFGETETQGRTCSLVPESTALANLAPASGPHEAAMSSVLESRTFSQHCLIAGGAVYLSSQKQSSDLMKLYKTRFLDIPAFNCYNPNPQHRPKVILYPKSKNPSLHSQLIYLLKKRNCKRKKIHATLQAFKPISSEQAPEPKSSAKVAWQCRPPY